MRSLLSLFVATATTLVASSGLAAQPGRNLTVDVEVAAVTMRGDTAHVTYVLTNRPTSVEELFQFTVDAPAPVTWIHEPLPRTDWAEGTKWVDRSTAHWAMLNSQMTPGSTSPALSFEAVGLPGLVTVWLRGYVPPETFVDDGTDTLPPEPIPDILALSIQGTTVGVSPIAGATAPAALLTRLDSLTARACGDLGWVTSSSLCTTLDSQLSSVERSLAATRNRDARTALEGFVMELDRARSARRASVTGAGYWLLRTNATFLIARLPQR